MSGIFSAGGAGNVGVSGFYPVTINDSLRFEDGSSAYLNRTPSSAGNRQTWTWSGWVKRANLSAVEQDLFSAGNSSTDRFEIIFSAAYPDQLNIYMNTGGTIGNLVTSQVFRDVSAFYHLVIAFDTTQATASNRVKIYVNGSQVTDFQTATYPSQNFNTAVNSTSGQFFSKRNYVDDRYYDGYMADVYMIDGQALDPTSFGEEKDGTWIPKSYSGSYGTNGFRLKFNGNTNDSSGNGNNWTANNISAHDYVPDSPTNNFATFNSLVGNLADTYSEGNLKIATTLSNGAFSYNAASIGFSSGKWYFEFLWNATSSAYGVFGIVADTVNPNTQYVGQGDSYSYRSDNGTKVTGGTTASYGASFTTGDIIGIAVDMDGGTLTFYKNGSTQGQAFTGISGTYFPACSDLDNNGGRNSTFTFNAGQDSTFSGVTTAGGNADDNGIGDFKYAPPSGFLALASVSLPEPTIIDGSEYFNTVLYTGDETSPRAITGVGFSPDWLWIKERSSTSSHVLMDSVRGASKFLVSENTNTESTATSIHQSFDADGFTIGNSGAVNQASQTYVAWNWKAGTSFSNSAGTNGATIASSGSVNTDAGFSIVSYTGTSANATVGHGLGVEPSMIFVKVRSTTNNWATYVKDIGNTKALLLDTSDQALTSSLFWNNTTPTSSVFSISTGNSVNNSGQTYIAYCFADVDGYSKVGSYTGGGTTFPFVFTGFRPAWIMVKETTNAASWYIQDSTRDVDNPVQALYPIANDTLAENSSWGDIMDLLSNGFKPRVNDTAWNRSGGTYIYLAFAETPQKYANAR